MRIRPGIELANLTDVGCVRPVNEDYYCYAEPENDQEFDRKGRLLVLADGMGGHQGGQVASGLAVDALRDSFLDDGGDDPESILIEGLARAQTLIVSRSAEDAALAGMGTTCTAAIVRDGSLYYGHVGDTRLYLLHDGHATQLTEDHSLVNRLVKSGAISPEEAESHEDKNVLTAALGMDSEKLAVDVSGPIPLAAGDVLLLASDGLHGQVHLAEMEEAVRGQTPYQACRTLVGLARQRGGPDNITVQILRILPEAR
jgi:serine/threonine protein phosphatase PrpC